MKNSLLSGFGFGLKMTVRKHEVNVPGSVV
jgi:hypothetical protein